MARAADDLPIGKHAAGPIILVAGEPDRIDEKRKGGQREGARQHEADLQPRPFRSLFTRHWFILHNPARSPKLTLAGARFRCNRSECEDVAHPVLPQAGTAF